MGISYLAALLEQAGFDARIFDAYFNGWSPDELVESVVAYQPHVLGITAMTHEIMPAAHLAERVKARLDIPAMIGGCHATALPSGTLEEFPAFDYLVHGEGEMTVAELLKTLFETASFQKFATIKGIAFRENGQVVVNDPRPPLSASELDNLPFPAFHHYYGDNSRALADKTACYVIASSRGCPHRCAFCMRVLGNKIRRRSSESICNEIELAVSRYGAHTIDFVDEVFLSNDNVTRQVLTSFIETGLSKRIRWRGLTHASAVRAEMIDLAKRAGCYRLAMGVESGDDETLRAIGKGLTVEMARKAVRVVKDAGLILDTYFIIGHPNETRETAQKTIDLAADLNTSSIAVGMMVPYPGTRIYEMAKKGEGGYRLLTEDWSRYDKYGGSALELQGLSLDEIQAMQRRAYWALYLRNRRFADLLEFLWEKRKGLFYLIIEPVKSVPRSITRVTDSG